MTTEEQQALNMRLAQLMDWDGNGPHRYIPVNYFGTPSYICTECKRRVIERSRQPTCRKAPPPDYCNSAEASEALVDYMDQRTYWCMEIDNDPRLGDEHWRVAFYRYVEYEPDWTNAIEVFDESLKVAVAAAAAQALEAVGKEEEQGNE